MKKILKSILFIAFVANVSADEKPEKHQKPQLMPVSVIEAKLGVVTITQDLSGRVAAFKTAEIRSRTNGIIEKRFFTEGSYVNKGDALYKIEDRILKATLKARKADLANARANSQLVNKTLKRYKKLLKQGAVSKQEYDTFSAQSEQSISQIEQAKANLKIAEINLDFTTVLAPISGRIDKALINVGGLATTNSTPLATIEQLDKVYIDFTQSSSELANLRKMQKESETKKTKDKNISILFDGQRYPEKAHLQFSSMSIDQATGSASLRAIVENPDKKLLPGMFVRVKLPIADKQNVIKVPQKSVHITPTGPVVFTIKDNALIPISINLGEMAGTDWIINSGVEVGIRIVTSDITFPLQTRAPVVGMTIEESQEIQRQQQSIQQESK